MPADYAGIRFYNKGVQEVPHEVLAQVGHHGALVDGSHIKFFSKSTIPQLLSENGFRVMSFNGTGRLPYLVDPEKPVKAA
ncbi:MAG: hypothetical protein WAL75_26120 [Terracidiphilus sp.]